MEDSSLPQVLEEQTTLPAGARLGKYQIVRLLGLGGMGAVYEALHTEIGKRVALKTLAPAIAALPGARQRFLREAQVTSRLCHSNIVDVTDMGTEGAVAYLVMELLAGEDLARRLERTGPMPPGDLVDLVLPVCSALVTAHEAKIIHRDLKPQNIFLAAGHRGIEPKVLDFGISKVSDSEVSELTRTGSLLGTPHYLAPEQVRDARAASAASDQYAMGVVLYRCLTNSHPFDGESVFAVLQAIVTKVPVPLRERRSDLPEGLDRVVERAMSRVPSERFPSVSALGRALLPYASVKARLLSEEAFAVGATPEGASTEGEPALPQAPQGELGSGPPTALAAVDSGTLSPSVTSLDVSQRGRPAKSRARAAVGAFAGATLVVGGLFLSLRPSHKPSVPPRVAFPSPPTAPAAPPPEAQAPAVDVSKAPQPTATMHAGSTEAEVHGTSVKTEAATPPKGTPVHPARRRSSTSTRHAPAPPPPEVPAPGPRRSLNPNGAPVID
jgi:serine/threonine protein kinase